MRRLVLAAVLVAGAAVVPAAHADPMEITGHPCALVARGDDAGDWSGILYGGPQKLSHVAGAPLVSGSLRCTLQVDGNQHSDPDLVSTQGAVTPAVAVAPPVPVTYRLDDWWDIASVCAQVDIPGEGTYYWNDYANQGNWSTDPASTCTSTIAMYVYPPYLRRIYNILDHAFDPTAAADPTVCPLLAALAPGVDPVTIDEEGDVAIAGVPFWDCPPYEA